MNNLINKTIADEVAIKLLEKVSNKIKETEKKLSERAIDIHIGTFPENILSHLLKLDVKYLNTRYYLNFKCKK